MIDFKDTANGFHFYGRLKSNPQTRVQSTKVSQGFISLEECKTFCDNILFDYTIYYFTESDAQIKVYDSNN